MKTDFLEKQKGGLLGLSHNQEGNLNARILRIISNLVEVIEKSYNS
jgi:hypothetical protein